MQSNVKVGVQWCFLLPYQWYHHHHLHAWMSPMKRIAAFFGQHQTICRHCQFWESTLPVQLFHIYLLPPAAFKNLVWKHIAYPPLFLPLPSPCRPPLSISQCFFVPPLFIPHSWWPACCQWQNRLQCKGLTYSGFKIDHQMKCHDNMACHSEVELFDVK